MPLSHDSILSIVELVLYAPLLPLSAYLGFKNGRHGILAFMYLNLACAIRMVSDIVQLATSADSNVPGLASAILSSVGLSPLLLGLSGFMHEIHRYLLETNSYTATKKKNMIRFLWFIVIKTHGMNALGMVLLIVGNVKWHEATSASQVSSARVLMKAGSIILLIFWLVLTHYAVWLFLRCRKVLSIRSLPELSMWTLLAAFPIGAKVVYSVVYSFDSSDPAVNPATGSFAIKVVLIVLVALLAVVLLTIGGWRSRDIKNYSLGRHASDSESGVVEVSNEPKLRT